MSVTFPSVEISIKDRRYGILDLTVNPFLRVRHTLGSRMGRPPRRFFEVWLEVVLGHDEAEPIPLPEMSFRFNDAFVFERGACPSVADGLHPSTLCDNYTIYHHFWNDPADGRDMLQAGFGPKSLRLTHPSIMSYPDLVRQSSIDRAQSYKCRAALAFRRASIYQPGSYARSNYPCTFQATQSPGPYGGTELHIHALQPFALDNHQPIPKVIDITNDESVSFWIHYPYSEATAWTAENPTSSIVAFLNRVAINGRVAAAPGLRVNYFPRIPYRYKVEESVPRLSAMPNLLPPPVAWGLKGYEPMASYVAPDAESSSVLHFNENQKDQTFFIHVFDRRLETERENLKFFTGIVLALAINLIATCLHSAGVLSNTTLTLLAMVVLLAFVCWLIIILYPSHGPPRSGGRLRRFMRQLNERLQGDTDT